MQLVTLNFEPHEADAALRVLGALAGQQHRAVSRPPSPLQPVAVPAPIEPETPRVLKGKPRRGGRPLSAVPSLQTLAAALARAVGRGATDDEIKSVLSAFGLERIRDAPEDRRADVIRALNELKAS